MRIRVALFYNSKSLFLISDIICTTLPPDIPTSMQYTLPPDDGYVSLENIVYPTYPTLVRMNQTLNSTHPKTEIPRNYMTNLT